MRNVIRDYPSDMIHDSAKNAARSLSNADLLWVLAAYELSKPKVHRVVMSEQLSIESGVT